MYLHFSIIAEGGYSLFPALDARRQKRRLGIRESAYSGGNGLYNASIYLDQYSTAFSLINQVTDHAILYARRHRRELWEPGKLRLSGAARFRCSIFRLALSHVIWGNKAPKPTCFFLTSLPSPQSEKRRGKKQRNLDKYSTSACLRANTETSFISTKVSENNWHISGEKFKKSRTPTRMKSYRFVMSHCGNPQVLINTHHYFSSCCLLR